MRTLLLWVLSCSLAIAKSYEVSPIVTWNWLLILSPIFLSGGLNFYDGFKAGVRAAITANKQGKLP